MAPYASDDSTRAELTDAPLGGRRKAVRYVVPVTVVGLAAATIGLVPALADSGDPDLPKISAQQLIEKIAASDTQRLSGTVKISTDLGLPDLGGLESGLLSGAAGGSDGSAADPTAKLTELASGMHTLRVAVDGPDRQKLSVLEDAAEYSLIHNGKDVWAYDSASNEVQHSTVDPEGKGGAGGKGKGEDARPGVPATPGELTEEALKAVDKTTSVTVDGTVQVAGRDAYKLLVKPRQSGSTVGAISVAVDAKTGVPLKFTLTPAGGGAAVVDAGFTQVRFAAPPASTFDFRPPKGAKVTEDDSADGPHGRDGGPGADRGPGAGGPSEREHGGDGADLAGLNVIGEGWTSVATFDTGAAGGPSGADKPAGRPDLAGLGGFLDSFGDKVKGDFGSGTVFSTRLINALVTDDGKVYVGAVTKDALVKAADAKQ